MLNFRLSGELVYWQSLIIASSKMAHTATQSSKMYLMMKSGVTKVAVEACVAKVSTLPRVHIVNATQVR